MRYEAEHPEKPMTPSYLHESAHQNAPKITRPPVSKATSVAYNLPRVDTHKGNAKSSNVSQQIKKKQIMSRGGSSDISGLLAQEPMSDGPSEGALDAEEYIRNIWLDYEFEVNQIVDCLNEMNIYGQVKLFDPSDKIY
jgi:2-iminoacetate synthase ThiH